MATSFDFLNNGFITNEKKNNACKESTSDSGGTTKSDFLKTYRKFYKDALQNKGNSSSESKKTKNDESHTK